MLALCLMLSGTHYAKNYAGIIGRGLLAQGWNFKNLAQWFKISLQVANKKFYQDCKAV